MLCQPSTKKDMVKNLYLSTIQSIFPISEVRRNKKELDKTFRILYLGRIGVAKNQNSISLFASAVSKHKTDLYKIELEMFTPGVNYRVSKIIGSLENVKILPPVNYEMVPALLTQYDLLLLPLDFTKTGFKYSQYSIPTKASEYMISGTPLIVFEDDMRQYYNNPKIKYYIGDVRNYESINSAMKGVDYVFQAAALKTGPFMRIFPGRSRSD